jgi:hypothetical protein
MPSGVAGWALIPYSVWQFGGVFQDQADLAFPPK